jgi:hypothetical protein
MMNLRWVSRIIKYKLPANSPISTSCGTLESSKESPLSGAEGHRQDQGTSCLRFVTTDLDFALRDWQEIHWTIWGPRVPHIWTRRLSQAGAVVGYSEDLAIEKRPKTGAIGRPKVQVISCQSLRAVSWSRRPVRPPLRRDESTIWGARRNRFR